MSSPLRRQNDECVAPNLADGEPVPLCALIVFDEESAYRRALRALVRLDLLAGGGIALRLVPWQIGQLDLHGFRTRSIGDADAADVVLLSLAGGDMPVETFRQWLLEGAARWRVRSRLLVALLGRADAMELPESPRVQLVKRTAEEAGLDFLAPTAAPRLFEAEPGAMCVAASDSESRRTRLAQSIRAPPSTPLANG